MVHAKVQRSVRDWGLMLALWSTDSDTGMVSKVKRKLRKLLDTHSVKVRPVAVGCARECLCASWLTRLSPSIRPTKRRLRRMRRPR